MELEFVTKLDKMRILDVKPVHSTFNLPDAKLVAPGRPEHSILLRPISHGIGAHAAAFDLYRRSRGSRGHRRMDQETSTAREKGLSIVLPDA